LKILWRRVVPPLGAPLSCVWRSDAHDQDRPIDPELQHLEARLRCEMGDIDAGEGVIRKQTYDRPGRRGLYRAPQSQGRDRTAVAAGVHHDLVRLAAFHLRHGFRPALAKVAGPEGSQRRP
jgi:hypothetical protein